MPPSQKELMLAGEMYSANDPELGRAHIRAQTILSRFNSLSALEELEKTACLRELFAVLGEGVVVKPTLRCDYGFNISVGARTFINYDCVLLDCNRIDIGEDVQIGPGVHLYTAMHPLVSAARRSGDEYALPIVVGDGVWLGGRSVVCPGVSIGDNCVIGAGSVVTKDLPPNVLAVGSPARVVRELPGG